MSSPAIADHFAIVLAAGASQRMGRDKPSLPWLNGKPLLEWTVDSLVSTGWFPIVVLGPHNHPAWIARLPVAILVLNPRAPEGKTTSLAAGAAAIPPSARHVLLTAVDQPRPVEMYREMRARAARHPESILVPESNGHRGHPVVLKSSLQPCLLALGESTGGLRGLLDDPAVSVRRLSLDPACPQWDLNTPAAYRDALAWFEAHSPGADGGHRPEIR